MKRIGIIGCGSIANVHARAINMLSDTQLAAFADIDQTRAVNFAEEYAKGKALAYDNLAQMLEEVDLDAVHICTPHYLHVPMAIEVMNKGLSVFCEKPPAISHDQFAQMETAAKCSKAHIGFCFQNRYNPEILKIREILQTGQMGEIIGGRAFVTWRRDEDYYKSDWKGRLATEGGGALINQSIHTLDLLLEFLGRPEEVKSGVFNHHLEGKIEVEDTVEAYMIFEGGGRACFYATTAYAADAPIILELQCREGTITVLDGNIILKQLNSSPVYIDIEAEPKLGKNYWGSGHLACIRDFYDCLDSGREFQCGLGGVKNTMETMMKIYDVRQRQQES